MTDVVNKTGESIKVSLNRWGEEKASSDFFAIASGATEHWDRHDGRGYVMEVSIAPSSDSSSTPYYVFHEDIICVHENNVIDATGLCLMPINQNRHS